MGGSVASASDANVSMMRLTQSICIALSGASLSTMAPRTDMKRATTLTVNWNCMNFLMQLYIFLPYLHAI